jgi:hypothetical protein
MARLTRFKRGVALIMLSGSGSALPSLLLSRVAGEAAADGLAATASPSLRLGIAATRLVFFACRGPSGTECRAWFSDSTPVSRKMSAIRASTPPGPDRRVTRRLQMSRQGRQQQPLSAVRLIAGRAKAKASTTIAPLHRCTFAPLQVRTFAPLRLRAFAPPHLRASAPPRQRTVAPTRPCRSGPCPRTLKPHRAKDASPRRLASCSKARLTQSNAATASAKPQRGSGK